MKVAPAEQMELLAMRTHQHGARYRAAVLVGATVVCLLGIFAPRAAIADEVHALSRSIRLLPLTALWS
jgi:hypothetical protein